MANLPGNRQDHPRVCGKDAIVFAVASAILGSPPRVREGLSKNFLISRSLRITPARAGRTSVFIKIQTLTKDHPRSRGKDKVLEWADSHDLGSPPRAREGPISSCLQRIISGITPACAGRTVYEAGYLNRTKDHPRVRGKDQGKCTA